MLSDDKNQTEEWFHLSKLNDIVDEIYHMNTHTHRGEKKPSNKVEKNRVAQEQKKLSNAG